MPDIAWLVNPTDDEAPRALTGDVRTVVIREQLERIAGHPGLNDEQVAEMLEEISQNAEFLAVVESETIRRTAQLRDTTTRSIEEQAIAATESGYHGYHPQHFASPEEMLQDALQDTKYGSTEFYNLRTIIRVILPYCAAHGIALPADLWEEGFRSKARYMADFLGPRIRDEHQAPELEQTVTEMVSQVLDEDISLSVLRAHFPPTPPSGVPLFTAWHYLDSVSEGYFLVKYTTAVQKALLERQLGDRVRLFMGTGTEPELKGLVRE